MSSILHISTGSIATIKSPDIVREFKAQEHDVTCVMTRAAQNFITPLTLTYLSGNKVYDDMFLPEDEIEMAHINLSRTHDIILVAPATANFIAKLANGICDDLALTICLASDKPIIICPAMNPQMYNHPATQRNLERLEDDGVFILKPEKGKMACGEVGEGRLPEVQKIINFTNQKLGQNGTKQDLLGKTALVTSGPTRESIDPVRYLSNHSSGKQGHAIAEELAKRGAEVFLISGPTNLKTPDNVKLIPVSSAEEMLEETLSLLPVDIAICAAAVADWKPKKQADEKIKKIGKTPPPMLNLIQNPDILFELSKKGKNRPQVVVGFAAETEHLVENSLVKLERKACDWIIANNVKENDVFDSDNNSVLFIDKNGVFKEIKNKPKKEIASVLASLLSAKLDNKG